MKKKILIILKKILCFHCRHKKSRIKTRKCIESLNKQNIIGLEAKNTVHLLLLSSLHASAEADWVLKQTFAFVTLSDMPIVSLRANPLARSPGQVKLDSDK